MESGPDRARLEAKQFDAEWKYRTDERIALLFGADADGGRQRIVVIHEALRETEGCLATDETRITRKENDER